jgi:hypothetical protein
MGRLGLKEIVGCLDSMENQKLDRRENLVVQVMLVGQGYQVRRENQVKKYVLNKNIKYFKFT